MERPSSNPAVIVSASVRRTIRHLNLKGKYKSDLTRSELKTDGYTEETGDSLGALLKQRATAGF